MATRVCTKCGIEQDLGNFSWSIPGIKRHSRCKTCRAKDRLEYYGRNKERELEYKWARQQRKRDEARRYINSIKSKRQCADCGTKDVEALTFDHVRGEKKMNISQMVNQGYSKKALDDELSKTEIVCSNCHMKREKIRRKSSNGDEYK